MLWKSWKVGFDGCLEKPEKKYFSAIGQHLLDNNGCASNFKKENYFILLRAKILYATYSGSRTLNI